MGGKLLKQNTQEKPPNLNTEQGTFEVSICHWQDIFHKSFWDVAGCLERSLVENSYRDNDRLVQSSQ